METVLLHKSAFLYVTSIFRLSSFVFANALLTGITKTFVPFYSSFPEIFRNFAAQINDQSIKKMNIFWDTIAHYNAGTWIYQVIITLTGIFLTYSLFKSPTKKIKVAMKLYLIFLNVWIAAVYYMIYCEPRSYNSSLAGFWGIMALFWIYDLKVNYTPFERTHKHTTLAVLLCTLPLAYPLFSIIRGMSFPMMTSPVMPCSIAVFTIGLLLAFSKRVNIFLVMFLCHWALIGFTKTYFFHIPEDFLLASSAVPGLYLFFKEYTASHLHTSTHFRARMINLALIIACGAIGVLFMISMVCELAQEQALSK